MIPAVIVVCGGISIFSYFGASKELKEQVLSGLCSLAADGAAYLKLHIDYHRLALEGVANRHVIRSMNWEQDQKPALLSEITRLGYLDMGVVTPDGNCRYPNDTTAFLGDRSYVQEAFSGKSVMSDVLISRVTGEPVIMLAAPIRGPEGVLGVLIARQDGYALSKIIDRIKFGKNGYSYMINKEGALIAHGNREFVKTARNFLVEGKTNTVFRRLSDMMQRMSGGETGTDEYFFMGSYRLFGYAPVPGTDWSFAVGAIRKDVYAGLYQMRNRFIIIFIISVALGFGVAVLLARNITRPVKQAVSVIRTIELNNNLMQSVPVTSEDEIGVLGKTVNSLLAKFREVVEDSQHASGSAIEINTVLLDKTGLSGEAFSMINGALGVLEQKVTEQNTKTDETMQSALTQKKIANEVENKTEKISTANRVLKESIESQTANTSELAAGVEEMTSNIHNVTKTSEQASALMTELTSRAETSGLEMQSSVGLSHQVTGAMQDIQAFSNIISEIAGQTNLLAMNAAIEAAHADSAGRGFAVVAEEIRKLADRSGAESLKARKNIESIHEKVNATVESMTRAAEGFAQVQESSQKAAEITNSIKNAMTEQSNGTQEMLLAVTDLQKSAAGVNEAYQDIEALVAEITQGGKEMKDLSERGIAAMESLAKIGGQVQKAMKDIASARSTAEAAVKSVESESHRSTEALNKLTSLVSLFRTSQNTALGITTKDGGEAQLF